VEQRGGDAHRVDSAAAANAAQGKFDLLSTETISETFPKVKLGMSCVPGGNVPRMMAVRIRSATIAAVALTPRYVVMTTLHGQLRVVPKDAESKPSGEPAPVAWEYTTPSGAMITSEPAVARGRIFFGSDDGCLYIVGPNGTEQGRDLSSRVVQRRAGNGRMFYAPQDNGMIYCFEPARDDE
jgi:hypothetical protein